MRSDFSLNTWYLVKSLLMTLNQEKGGGAFFPSEGRSRTTPRCTDIIAIQVAVASTWYFRLEL